MNNRGQPDRILELRLSGKYAHFRKFYTNASSLTYILPPRTSLAGLLASILMLPRDSYYKELSSSELQIAVGLKPGCNPRRFIQTMNYMSGNSEKNLLNDASKHMQCRFELLAGNEGGNVDYRIWIGYSSQNTLLHDLECKLQSCDWGFGIYLGQRQFRADIEVIDVFGKERIRAISESEYVDSAIDLSMADLDIEKSSSITIERVPLEQELVVSKKEQHRSTVRLADLAFKSDGTRMFGRFNNCYELSAEQNDRIYFL